MGLDSIKANEEFPKTNVLKQQAKHARHSLGRQKSGSTQNEMHCGMQYGGFSCLPNLTDIGHIYIFFQNTICRNVHQTKTSSKFTEFFLWRKA